MESAKIVSDIVLSWCACEGGVLLYVPMIMVRTPMIKQPPNPNALGESMIILVMPANAPSAIAVLQLL